MIRLSELERKGQIVKIKLEGNIDGCALAALSDTCASYARNGVRELCLVVDELRSIDPLVKSDLMELLEGELKIRFQHPGAFLAKLLMNWGILENGEER